jgi:hypothetical protein
MHCCVVRSIASLHKCHLWVSVAYTKTKHTPQRRDYACYTSLKPSSAPSAHINTHTHTHTHTYTHTPGSTLIRVSSWCVGRTCDWLHCTLHTLHIHTTHYTHYTHTQYTLHTHTRTPGSTLIRVSSWCVYRTCDWLHCWEWTRWLAFDRCGGLCTTWARSNKRPWHWGLFVCIWTKKRECGSVR